MLDVNPKSVRWERRRVDVKRDGDKFVTLYSTEDLPERVIEVGSSLVGLLGSAYQRVDEMLSGYAQIPAKPPPRPLREPSAGPSTNGVHGPSPTEKNGVAGRRRRGRRSRARKA
jgi:hypothetical protein